MRKEQILLLVAAGIGALLIWSATGRYSEVGAASLPDGKTVEPLHASQSDPGAALKGDPLKGRALSAQVRPEKRAPMPELPAPAPLPLWFVRPPTSPGVEAGHWRGFRGTIFPVKVVAEEPKETKDDTTPTTDDNNNKDKTTDPNAGDLLNPRNQKPFDPKKQAVLVRLNDEEVLVRLETAKGEPDWTILEKWPNVTFTAHWLNSKNGTEIGVQTLKGPEELAGYKTVHLAKKLDNEFNEERIRRTVKDTDREALVSFAKWTYETLPSHRGMDDIPYGVDAIKLAIGVLEKAKAIQRDLTLTRILGDYYRAAYDLEGELKTYTAYMNEGHVNDTGAQMLVADAYERLGALAAARALFEKAAQTGDPEARLRIGLLQEKEGDDAAMETLRNVAGVPATSGRASVAMARIALGRGAVAEAAGYLDQAKGENSAAKSLVLGAVQYAQGKYSDAEKTFRDAKIDETRSDWRSDRGMALVAAADALAAKGDVANAKLDLDEAEKEFHACLDTDPLNLLDPLFGLGDVFQHRGTDATAIQRANDYFETALARSPDDPWILLRLGTIRLRDGQADKALKAALHLLDVEPGCNEGLWLAARSAASLDKPDYEKAVAFIRRAVEKEPENKEFVHEYARILILAGRLDEALKVLETATDVKTGIGRNDGRLLALLSWARFLGKRPVVDVFEALQRGKLNQPDDVTKEWLANIRGILELWDKTRIWVDNFDRQASQIVGNGWRENEGANGTLISIDGAHAVFVSQAVKQAAPTRDQSTKLDRDEDLGRFKSVEASFKACPNVETIFHMYFGALPDRSGAATNPKDRRAGGGQEIGIGCDRSGTMVLWVTGNGVKTGGTQEQIVKDAAGNPRQWPMDDFHTVKIVRKDDQKGIYEILLDDEKIAGVDGKTTFEVQAFSLMPGKMFPLGFLVDADTGANVSVSVEYVQVTKTNR